MPDGYEATRLIKLTDKGQQTPIIALTASLFEDERRKTITLGMQGYIRKPFRENELFTTIGNVLGITYIYEDDSTGNIANYNTDSATIGIDLASLPNKLVSQMRDAVAVADLDLLIELINSIDSAHSDLARHLITRANNFDYDYLLQILNEKEI